MLDSFPCHIYILATVPGHRAVWHGNEASVYLEMRLVYTLASVPGHN